ncbi:hypothetical protein AC579_651 [Pseudocercospora musae]|uniref:Cytochrome P450 n=1 Tax=Pseudocercospora musae TaxID=113226 RepID=A0A139I8P3_9PEZI|nr:hypothetical protein AC579_651 [Pseudocercospora musae]
MIDVLLMDASTTWTWHVVTVAAIAALGFALILAAFRRKSDPLSHLSRYEVAPNQFPSAEALMIHAYHKASAELHAAAVLILRLSYHRDKPYVVSGSWRRWDTVILPPKLFDSIKSLPENELSFYDALDTRFLHHLTTIKVPWDGGDIPMLRALAMDLQRHLVNHLSDIEDEAEHAYDTLVPRCDDGRSDATVRSMQVETDLLLDWVEIYPMDILPRILALVSGRILVGLPLSRDPEFLDLKLNFFRNSFVAMYILGHYVPAPLRSTVAPLMPWIRKLKKAHKRMQAFMTPVINQRQYDHEQGKKTHSDLLEWVMSNAPPHLRYNVQYQSHAQLITNVASIQSLYVATSHAWFDVAAHPECVEELREEWASVRENSSNGGRLSFEGMAFRTRKLDSFIKESARYNPSQLTALEYITRRDIVLPSSGTLLPKGTYISTSIASVARDPALYPDPEIFDPFRFSKLREQCGSENKFLSHSTGIDQLTFGYGRHPCPGRYYATHVLKIMLAKLIERYEVRLPDGVERPKNVENWVALMPDAKVPVLIKRRNG